MADAGRQSGESPARPDRRRRRLAPSLRGLLLVILGLAWSLGWWVNAARNQRAAVAALATAPYEVRVDYDDDPSRFRDDVPVGRRLWRAVKYVVPDRLQAALGKDYWHNVLRIGVSKLGPPGPEDRAVFRKLATVRSLEGLAIDFEVVDDDLVQLARLPQLRDLELTTSSPGLTGSSLHALAGMPRLEFLQIHDAPIDDDALAPLTEMRGLRVLILGDMTLGPTDTRMIAIKGDGFAHLTGLPLLTSLQVNSPALRGESLEHVAKLQHLDQLSLRGGSITNDGLRFLAPLSNLQWLSIMASSRIDGTGFRHLEGLTRVKAIYLGGDSVTDTAIPFLARLPALQEVRLYDTRVTASGLEQFQSAPRLFFLEVTPAMTGDTSRLKQALPRCRINNNYQTL